MPMEERRRRRAQCPRLSSPGCEWSVWRGLDRSHSASLRSVRSLWRTRLAAKSGLEGQPWAKPLAWLKVEKVPSGVRHQHALSVEQRMSKKGMSVLNFSCFSRTDLHASQETALNMLTMLSSSIARVGAVGLRWRSTSAIVE
jgi:hypothetical protein